MSKILKNSVIGIICLLAICFWIYNGLENNNDKDEIISERYDNSDLIFQLLKKEVSLEYDSILSSDYISYTDTSNFSNILKNQKTHPITIGEISPYNTTEFLSISYNNSTLNNYKNYLKNNQNFNKWDSLNNALLTQHNFSMIEFSSYLNEIGYFKKDNLTYYYLKSEEPYNIASLLNLIEDSISNNYCKKISSNHLFPLLISEIFLEDLCYYKNNEEYFIFSSDSVHLKDIYSNNLMINNPVFSQYKNRQFTNYSLNYFYDASNPSDSLHNIISYQLRGEQNGVISNFKNFKFERITDTISDIVNTNTNGKNYSTEEKIINEIIKKTQKSLQSNSLGEITYYISNGESFRSASVKLKEILEEAGYNYNKVKVNHVFFITNKSTTKLRWNDAVNLYLDKQQPLEGDYFYMEKFYY
tara:strand:- start:1515 stop:2759 length:1245 start_codon:yes stop_codon:yes gene_type:complete